MITAECNHHAAEYVMKMIAGIFRPDTRLFPASLFIEMRLHTYHTILFVYPKALMPRVVSAHKGYILISISY